MITRGFSRPGRLPTRGENQRGHRMFVSNGTNNAGFLLTATRNEQRVNSVLRHGRHGIFLCRGDRFASIEMAAESNSACQRSSEPHSMKPEQRSTLGSLGYRQFRPGSDRRQQATPSPATHGFPGECGSSANCLSNDVRRFAEAARQLR